jgi:hypothetical protein
VGEYSGTFEIWRQDASLLRVQLSGVGLAPGALTSETAGHDFAGQQVGSPATPFVWVIRNDGDIATAPLRVQNDNPLDFSTSSDCEAASLPPGGSCQVTVGFVPSSAGVLQAAVTVQGGDQRITLNLLGRGQQRLSITTVGAGRVETSLGGRCEAGCEILADDQIVTLDAQTDNGSDSVFAGWTGAEECPGPHRSCTLALDRNRSVQANFRAMTNNLVFMSSESFLPTLGSAAAYDAACNRLATAAGINNAAGNGFVAAMSGPDTFWMRMGATPTGWMRMDGLPLGDRAGLLAKPPVVHYSVRYDEYGSTDTDRAVWSGTWDTDQVDLNCNGWTSASENASTYFGDGHRTREWVSWGVGACSYPSLGVPTMNSVLCLGRTKSAPINVPTFSGKRIWVTNTPYLVGSQTPDQKCQADRPPGVQQARALIAYVGRHAADLLGQTTTYVSPDGHLVGTGGEIAARQMPGGIWMTASSAPPRSIFTWTGEPYNASVLPSAAHTCNDWTSTTGTSSTGYAGSDIWPALAYGSSQTCDAQDRGLYCFEL